MGVLQDVYIMSAMGALQDVYTTLAMGVLPDVHTTLAMGVLQDVPITFVTTYCSWSALGCRRRWLSACWCRRARASRWCRRSTGWGWPARTRCRWRCVSTTSAPVTSKACPGCAGTARRWKRTASIRLTLWGTRSRVGGQDWGNLSAVENRCQLLGDEWGVRVIVTIYGRDRITINCWWTTYRHCKQYVCQQLVVEVGSQWIVDGRDTDIVNCTYVSN